MWPSFRVMCEGSRRIATRNFPFSIAYFQQSKFAEFHNGKTCRCGGCETSASVAIIRGQKAASMYSSSVLADRYVVIAASSWVPIR
eukprot:scaffold149467_cov17-Prasinocladus_malaysianus.AAC.1